MKNLTVFAITLISGLLISCKDDIAESPTGSIVGTVADMTTGEPVPTVSVNLDPGGISTLTGNDGNYMFEDLNAGTYTISLVKEGYKPAEKTIEVVAGDYANGYILIERIPATVTVDRNSLDFGEGTEVNSLSFKIVNSGYEDLEWTIEYECEWISRIKDTEGTLQYGRTQTIVVFIDRSLLLPGHNETVVVVRTSNGRSDLWVTAVGADRDDVIVNMTETGSVMMNSAEVYGLLVNEGIPRYNELGFVFSDEPEPVLENSYASVTVGTTFASGDTFGSPVESLASGTTYYVRAYAKNSNGVFYSSNELTFHTVGKYSEIMSENVSDIDYLTGEATFNATVVDPGIPAFTEKGFCWSTSSSPTVDDEKVRVSGTSAGHFSTRVSNLDLQRDYYVRPYLIQNGNVIYGDVMSFNTVSDAPSLTTSSVTDLTATSAVFNAYISNSGTPEYTERGFCWSGTRSVPSLEDNKIKVQGSGEGNYSTEVDDLDYNSSYYVRAYVIQNERAFYGNVVSFTTSLVPTEISTGQVSEIGTNEAVFNGEISEVGDPRCSQYGFCYSATTDRPTINDKKVTKYGGIKGRISMDADNLDSGTTYYVRAYAIQEGQPVYGETVVFTTAELPSVVTLSPTEMEPVDMGGGLYLYYSARFNGNVTFSGDPSYTSKGFAYGTTRDPSATADNSVTVSGRGEGKYSAVVSNLTANLTYYVRAWVKAESGYVYGESIQFSTF